MRWYLFFGRLTSADYRFFFILFGISDQKEFLIFKSMVKYHWLSGSEIDCDRREMRRDSLEVIREEGRLSSQM